MTSGLTQLLLICYFIQFCKQRAAFQKLQYIIVLAHRRRAIGNQNALELPCFLISPPLPLVSCSQMFPGTEGWPFLRYHGSCGRVMVWAGSTPIRSLFSSLLELRADVAYQLLHITQSLSSNSLQFNLFYTNVTEDMFGTLEDGRVFIVDTGTIGIIDLKEGYPPDEDLQVKHIDVFSCLTGSCKQTPPCGAVRAAQSFILLCKHVLHNLLGPNDVRSRQLPRAALDELTICSDQSQSDRRIMDAVQALKNILQSLRPCSPLYGYRYPECLYNDKF